MRLDAIAIGEDPPAVVNLIVEVPIGGEPIKYEMDKASGTMVVDRFLYTSMRYPGNYGFIPHTLAEDGDPIDALLISQRSLVPGCIVATRPIGVLKMEDEAGGDEKVIVVPVSRISKRYDHVHEISDISESLANQIEHFFLHYKDLEPGKWVKITGWLDAEKAKLEIQKAVDIVANSEK